MPLENKIKIDSEVSLESMTINSELSFKSLKVGDVNKKYYTKEEIDQKEEHIYDCLDDGLDSKVDKSSENNILYGRGMNADWNPSYSSDYNDKAWQIVQRNGASDVLVPTIPSSDNASTSKKYVDDAVASKESYKTFPDSWIINSTTLVFCQSIQNDTNAHAGSSYLGTLMCNDLPSGMVQVEAIVDIISEGANGKCIDITITSLEVTPYRWTYSYGIVNGSVVAVGWLGTQEQLISGTNIKTINNESILGNGNINIENKLKLYRHEIDGGFINSVSVKIYITAFDPTPITSKAELANLLNGSKYLHAAVQTVNYSNPGNEIVTDFQADKITYSNDMFTPHGSSALSWYLRTNAFYKVYTSYRCYVSVESDTVTEIN